MTRQKTRFALALIAIVLGGLIVGALIFWPIPEGNREPLMLALGLVLAWGGTAYGYFFGSSEGSQQKTELLATRPTGEPDDPVHVEEDHR